MKSALLQNKSLSQLAQTVVRSPVEAKGIEAGILHLGIGAFHRAHQAVYTQAALELEGGNWAIRGVSMRSAAVRDLLARQDYHYSVVTLSESQKITRLISVIKDVIFAPETPDAVIDAIADPKIQIITLTITEKGYHQDPVSGKLSVADPEIIQDLDMRQVPTTALGFLVRGLQERQARGGGPVTLISCDNLPENGRVLAGLLQDFCAQAVPDILPWLEHQVTCPCSMVDGIVPATTEVSRNQAEELLGLRDEAAIVCEEFRQWVIEDNFAGARPAWEAAGVELVTDIRPFEDMKLRLLNGSHSALAYLGYLNGYQTIAEAMADSDFEIFVHRLIVDEAGAGLILPEGYDLEVCGQKLIRRFSNPYLAHRTWQICMDGSQKLPQRLLTSLYGQLKTGREMPCTLLAVAAWMMYVGGKDEQGGPIEVSDPLSGELVRLHKDAGDDAEKLVKSFLGLEKVFGSKDTQPPDLADLLTSTFTNLRDIGAGACVVKLSEQTKASTSRTKPAFD